VKHLQGENLQDAVKRNILKVLQGVEIPEGLWGKVADIAFQSLTDPQEAVAIRVFSMTVAWNICRKVPELRIELRMIIEDQWEFASAGFRARGRKILREMKKCEAAEKK